MKSQNILGISAGFHDAAVSMLDSKGNILFAGHAERYSKRKNDAHVNDALIAAALHHGAPGTVAYYERPWVKKLQQAYSGQYNEAFDLGSFTVGQYLRRHLSPGQNRQSLLGARHYYSGHHQSHAAAGFQTSPFDRATVVVIDAIGELDTVTIWGAEYSSSGKAKYTRLWTRRYPHSIGMFYSAITQRIGLHPMDEEYITMGMAAYGQPGQSVVLKHYLVQDEKEILFKTNMHLGLDEMFMAGTSDNDLAAMAQELCEKLVYNIMQRAADFKWSDNLVYMGGVALNCSANRNLGKYFDNIWIMPSPGDSGSSLGAAAMAYGGRLDWNNAFLGDCIPGAYPVDATIDVLLRDRIVGVASGRAEFGPRALGNRSLLADPRGPDIKDKVNEIKRRQQFRPFAPVILEEMADQYFDMPKGFSTSPYMQTIAHCKHPDVYPAIVHHDGTSRVQTVPNDSSGIRLLLEKWFALTGCPMLLNTSLNIRGEPVVNDRTDADRFEKLYNVTVCS
jgi:carbamoyltransferase